MKFITNYIEFDSSAKNSLLDSVSDEPAKNKKAVLEYLKSGKEYGTQCSSIYDHVEDTPTGETIMLFTDGEYIWGNDEIYHFEKYNMQLKNEFIDKVLKQH